ncbi:MAG TPA: cupredoxin domain-containing protein [Mycobacteriales bacterium]|nr:cupredoxin domain-containing protein [Mycobacteriales bacterium]
MIRPRRASAVGRRAAAFVLGWRVLGFLALGCPALVGCQSSQPVQATAPQQGEVTVTPGPDGVQAVEVDANDQYRFIPATIVVTVGKVRITVRNIGGTPHNLTFRDLVAGGPGPAGHRVAVPTIRGGAEQSVDFSVTTPGRYRFVCTIHESLNQTGTLVVTR